MFNVGGGEILVILLVALIVLGPQRLPEAARQLGKALAQFRRMSSSFQAELRSALDDTTSTTPASGTPTPTDSGARQRDIASAIEAASDHAGRSTPAPGAGSERDGGPDARAAS